MTKTSPVTDADDDLAQGHHTPRRFQPDAHQPATQAHGDTPSDPEEIGTISPIKRGRPSIAEAEALSGRILDASWHVLLAGGFETFTFDRVARHAHIGKATIYSRFASKTDLMRALLLRRIERRADHFHQRGADLPLEQAFRLRAAETIKMLFSPDGILIERLIDWIEQETGEGQTIRANAYRNAIEMIRQSLARAHSGAAEPLPGTRRDSAEAPPKTFADTDLVARLWLEGLMGHAKLAYTEGASSSEEIERWAAEYTRFFFAGLRAMVGTAHTA